MEVMNLSTAGEPGSGKGLKGLGLGALGLGLACLGCCLAPLLGILAASSLGASILAGLSSHSVLIGLLAGATGLAALWIWRFQRKSCCSNPGADCGSTRCGTRPSGPRTRNNEVSK